MKARGDEGIWFNSIASANLYAGASGGRKWGGENGGRKRKGRKKYGRQAVVRRPTFITGTLKGDTASGESTQRGGRGEGRGGEHYIPGQGGSI